VNMTWLWKNPCRIAMALACWWIPPLLGQVQNTPAGSTSSLRDPTLAPMSSASPGASPQATDGAGEEGFSILVVDGRPHVIIGTRLYAQGQKLGGARIERISETEVWLREGGQLRKVSQFAGIERRNVSPAAAVPACAASAPRGTKSSRTSKTSPPVSPCVGAQP
jgi:hypothetical protein